MGDVLGDIDLELVGLVLQHTLAHIVVRLLDGRQQAGAEVGGELIVHLLELLGQEGAGEHHLASVFLQGLDHGQELFLHFFLALEEVDILQ